MLKEVKIKDNENIVIHGRTVAQREPAVLLWGGASIELRVKCSELWLELAGPFLNRECWIAVEIDGELMARQMVKPQREWICLFRGKDPEREARVRVIKDEQAMNDECEHRIELWAVKLDGEILPAKKYSRRLEFIGDSINSGEGTIGAKDATEWSPLYFSHTHAYPYMVAKALDGDYRVISQGGWGIYASWDNNPECNIPRIYEGICSVCVEDFKVPGVHERNDFNAWVPDVVIVNLGTNDDGSFHNPPYTDPKSGVTYKQRMEGDQYVEEDLRKVKDGVRDFLHTIRRCNPQAYIIWAFGILGNGMEFAIRAGMEEYQKASGDERVEYLPIPVMTDETVGSLGHPGVKAHALAAEVIEARIREILK